MQHFLYHIQNLEVKNLKLLLSGYVNTILVLNAEWTIENREKKDLKSNNH